MPPLTPAEVTELNRVIAEINKRIAALDSRAREHETYFREMAEYQTQNNKTIFDWLDALAIVSQYAISPLYAANEDAAQRFTQNILDAAAEKSIAQRRGFPVAKELLKAMLLDAKVLTMPPPPEPPKPPNLKLIWDKDNPAPEGGQ